MRQPLHCYFVVFTSMFEEDSLHPYRTKLTSHFTLPTVSTAPKHYSQPDPNTKMSKNKKKKLKKKQKAKQALLETQMRELEEMEEKEARQALEACDITTTNTTGEALVRKNK